MPSEPQSGRFARQCAACALGAWACLAVGLYGSLERVDVPPAELALDLEVTQATAVRLEFEPVDGPSLRPVELPVAATGRQQVTLPLAPFKSVRLATTQAPGCALRGGQWRFLAGGGAAALVAHSLVDSAGAYMLELPPQHTAWMLQPTFRRALWFGVSAVLSLLGLALATAAPQLALGTARLLLGAAPAALALLMAGLCYDAERVHIVADVSTASTWQVFIDRGEGFSAPDSARVPALAQAASQDLSFSLRGAPPARVGLRLQLSEAPGTALIRSLCIGGLPEHCWRGVALASVLGAAQAAELSFTPEGAVVTSQGAPQIALAGDFLTLTHRLAASWLLLPLLLSALAMLAGQRAMVAIRWGQTASARLAVPAAALAVALSFLARLPIQPFVDEADNLIGGMMLGRGGVMFRDFFTQHTPLLYHLMGLLYLAGARAVSSYRIAWMLFIVGTLCALYRAHRRALGPEPFLAVLLGLAVAHQAYQPQLILSDGLQSLALLTAFFTYHRFDCLRDLPRGQQLALSGACWAAVMVAFLSVLPLFVLALGFGWKELAATRQDPRKKLPLRRYAAFVALMAAPFALALGVYWAQGTLGLFYEESFLFNRVYYAAYVPLTQSAPKLLVTAVANTWRLYRDLLVAARDGGLSMAVVMPAGASLAALAALGAMGRKQGISAGLAGGFVVMCGMRYASAQFHALPYYTLCLATAGLGAARLPWPELRRLVHTAGLIAAVLVAALYGPRAAQNLARLPVQPATSAHQAFILEHSTPQDTLWQNVLFSYLYLYTDRLPASRFIDLAPWVWDAYKDALLDDLAKNAPKFVVFDPQAKIWGHVTASYAPELVAFIEAHYERPPAALSPPEQLWVRKGAMGPAPAAAPGQDS